MKILVDMSLSPDWVPFLVDHGFQAVHWSKVGRASAPDREIFDYASKNNFAVFTHDLDFGTLLAMQKTNGPSVLQIRSQDVLPTAIGELVLRAITATYSQLQAGALVTIDPARHRIRLLPVDVNDSHQRDLGFAGCRITHEQLINAAHFEQTLSTFVDPNKRVFLTALFARQMDPDQTA